MVFQSRRQRRGHTTEASAWGRLAVLVANRVLIHLLRISLWGLTRCLPQVAKKLPSLTSGQMACNVRL